MMGGLIDGPDLLYTRCPECGRVQPYSAVIFEHTEVGPDGRRGEALHCFDCEQAYQARVVRARLTPEERAARWRALAEAVLRPPPEDEAPPAGR